MRGADGTIAPFQSGAAAAPKSLRPASWIFRRDEDAAAATWMFRWDEPPRRRGRGAADATTRRQRDASAAKT